MLSWNVAELNPVKLPHADDRGSVELVVFVGVAVYLVKTLAMYGCVCVYVWCVFGV